MGQKKNSGKPKKTPQNIHYNKLFSLSREAKILEGIQCQLDWDAETYMPKDAAGIRAEQLELLAGIIHQRRTDKAYRNALQRLIDLRNGKILDTTLTARQQAAVREWHRSYSIATALPTAFVKDFAKVTSDATLVWREARTNNDFKSFAPYLQQIVDKSRRKAELLGYAEHPYDALVDLYEPGMTTKELIGFFKEIKSRIVPLLAHIDKAKPADDKVLQGNFPEPQQMELANRLLDAVGFDRNHGRLDISAHPFSRASHPTDSRITTRILTHNVVSNLLAVLHEYGHALYELNLPTEEYGSPLGEYISYGIHESQSRFWETRIGLSKPFWTFCLPLLRQSFPKAFQKANADVLYRAVNKVKRSLIRIESDEVTYTLHIILRFELEMRLIEGSLKVKEVPEAWNAKMQELLGITPPNDSSGCLQDIHWSMGAFGYFPSYALGNVYASHLFQGFEQAHPTWERAIAKGDFTDVTSWLRDNVHCHGKAYTAQEVLKKATGKKPSTAAYIRYLEDKYR